MRVVLTFWDGGRGHLGEVLAVARAVRSRGCGVAAITSRRHEPEVRAAIGDAVCVVENRPPTRPAAPSLPPYSHAFRHAQRLRGLGFDNTTFLHAHVLELASALTALRADVVLNDYHDAIRMAAALREIPVVGVTKTTGTTCGHTLGWWRATPADLVLPDCLSAFNEVRTRLGLDAAQDEREHFEGDICVVPSCSALDPLIKERPGIRYVGLIENIPRVKPRTPSGKAEVFVYMGDGNNRPDWGFDRLLFDTYPRLGSSVVVRISGTRQRYPLMYGLAATTRRVEIREGWTPAEVRELLASADAVVSHGGNTALQALSLGCPVVAIPWTSESAWTWMAARFGAAVYLEKSSMPLERRLASELGSGVEVMGHWRTEMNASELAGALHAVLDDSSFRDRARELGEELRLGGPDLVVDQLLSLHGG